MAADETEKYLPEFMRTEGSELLGLVSDISQGDYDHSWEESFRGKFPEARK